MTLTDPIDIWFAAMAEAGYPKVRSVPVHQEATFRFTPQLRSMGELRMAWKAAQLALADDSWEEYVIWFARVNTPQPWMVLPFPHDLPSASEKEN